MSVNDYWIAKMQATEAGGEETVPEEETVEKNARETETVRDPDTRVLLKTEDGYRVGTQRDIDAGAEEYVEPEDPRSEDGRAIANPEIREDEFPQVDENYRPVADPDKHEGEVYDYNPATDPEDFVPGPDGTVEADYRPEIPPGKDPVPAETIEPGEVDEGKVIAGTTLAPGLVDEEEKEKRETAAAEKVERDAKNAKTAAEASAEAVAEQTSDEEVPAETVVEDDDDDVETVDFVDAPEDKEPEEDTYEADKAAATEKVPTQASNKQEIRDYLTYQHGIDPEDLQDQTKSELLALVDDLAD